MIEKKTENIYDLEDLVIIRDDLRSDNKKVVFTNGCFDFIHRGHIEYLRKARELGDFLIVAVNTDDSVRRLKGKGRPVNNEEDRAVVLASLKPVDAVCLFDEDTPAETIAALHPDVLVKGADYKVEEIVGHEQVLAEGGKVIPVPLVSGRSTTSIIDKIKKLPD
ncbi:MAG: D-glycero-beta-D-manno-heptose 1-phosphate adenylyltransferase [bacterium]|nr:D-glycero-beta-D-manno-heptose 1-phosphate adenylyltransferase [bacterium]